MVELRIVLVGILVLLVAGCQGAPQRNARATIREAGTWQAFGGTDAAGRPVCGMTSKAGEDRAVTILRQAGDEALIIRITKGSWRIPEDQRMRVNLRFDGQYTWTANAAALPPDGIYLTIEPVSTEAFLGQFASASRLQLTFPEGTEPPWGASLSGSAAVTRAWRGCIQGLDGNRARPSPGAAPTQPFVAPRA